jgi:tetratricopeptide (TPR) repeat protein
MIGLARLQHRKGQMQASIRLYREALNIHRNDPVILNDLGLCYARNGQLDHAISVLRIATRVAPDREMYGNNLAAALVEANRAGEAVAHLTPTYGTAIANYNVGYLLKRSGRENEAAQFLARSLEIDPTMEQARTMLDRAQPQVSSLPKAQSSAPRYYTTDTTPQHAYRPLPTSTPDHSRPTETTTSRPPQLPEHRNNIPRRNGPFGFVPAKQNAHTSLVSYEEEEEGTTGKEPVSMLPAPAATVDSLRRLVNQVARGGKLEPPEPTR